MGQLRIYDTDSNQVDNVVTFNEIIQLLQSIRDENAGSLSWTGKGSMHIKLRCSSGLVAQERIEIDDSTPTKVDDLVITAEYANGFPFVISDQNGELLNSPIHITDENVFLLVASEGAGIIRATPNRTSAINLLAVSKDCVVDGWSLDGGGSNQVGAIYAPSNAVAFTRMKIIGCHRDFYGASRCSANVTFDHCTFENNSHIRSAGPITNSIFTNMDMLAGDGLHAGCDNNIFDVDQTQVNYSGVQGDANSIFNITVANELLPDTFGTYDIKFGSILAFADSLGGAVGAFANVLIEAGSITNNQITRGLSFTINMTGYRARANTNYVEVWIKDAAGDQAEYPCSVISNTDFSIAATPPSAGSIPAMSNANIIVRPIISL